MPFRHTARNSSLKTGAIILGGHVQSYGIVRIFGQNSIPSIVIDNTRFNIARHSKYCIGFYEAGYDDLLEYLVDLGRKGKYKGWLIMPTDDYHVRLLSQNKEELNKYFNVTVDNWETINIFFNKRHSYPLAQEAGVPVPETFYPDCMEDLTLISSTINFPCIIKPAVMLDFYKHFKKKVFVCNNKDELTANYQRTCQVIAQKDVLIQEIIPGSSEQQYSVCMFFDRDKFYNHLVARRKRQHPIDFGNATTYAETVDIPILKEYAHKILSRSGFFGLCEVEFKFDERDGHYKFLEVNPRTWKWHLISQAAGVPFLESFYNYFFEGRPIITKSFKKAGWRDVVTDLPVIFNMMRKGLFVSADRRKTVSAVASLGDFKPFLFQVLLIPYNFFNR